MEGFFVMRGFAEGDVREGNEWSAVAVQPSKVM